jgi:hypothetical protein
VYIHGKRFKFHGNNRGKKSIIVTRNGTEPNARRPHHLPEVNSAVTLSYVKKYISGISTLSSPGILSSVTYWSSWSLEEGITNKFGSSNFSWH